MLGTIVNFFSIIVGSLLGLVFKKGMPERINETIMSGLALCVLLIGVSGTLKSQNILLIIFSIVIGGIAGELVNIDKLLNNLGDFIEGKLKGKGNVSEGFVTASLLYCVGAMAIVGSLQSGLEGNHKILFAKSILDGVSAIIFSSTLGIGVVFSAFSVLIYQGLITLMASFLKPLLVTATINEMTAVGSLLIIGLSFNMLKISKIKVANLLPAVIIPILYQVVLNFIK
ncbi:putative membrane protein YdfK [Caloramator mitchellensis]|uniref:Putative membrane protein YdfK n=1 Tax=Caloramator mitchellensis TaxID=908809 RepID=A0A0R3JUR1_CALMK|nr:DUF554 domain-containing protein [Caloramator mitchellensis]KRQ87305.1 putative membrane protein YdfK [Caloramator mitchellensis]